MPTNVSVFVEFSSETAYKAIEGRKRAGGFLGVQTQILASFVRRHVQSASIVVFVASSHRRAATASSVFSPSARFASGSPRCSFSHRARGSSAKRVPDHPTTETWRLNQPMLHGLMTAIDSWFLRVRQRDGQQLFYPSSRAKAEPTTTPMLTITKAFYSQR